MKPWMKIGALVIATIISLSGCSGSHDTASKSSPSEEHPTTKNQKTQNEETQKEETKNKSKEKKHQEKKDSSPSSSPVSNKPLLKNTVKITADGKHVVTNPASLLVCADKKRNLPSDYVPEHLVVPDIPFPFNHPENYEKSYMRKVAAEPIRQLFDAAKQAGYDLTGVSGYRSYKRQEAVFASNVKQFGSREKANQASALPGQSEHQTGLSMDVSTQEMGATLTQDFGQTAAGNWLAAHAWEHGFIIRYPKGKEDITGYEYEPWHLRYVGKKPAKEIHAHGLTLEEYLSKTSV